ncbi:MAG: tRNA (adenosine(37)-N6)-dimethylallyltransferase MiaA [Anaerolineaceae bacterium]|jgi:tRNA dimethylallyltransferase|nr:tRNA (adenosine(37)-N6)-dimethylallyltransferase MiaA [Anaerolineaceae bacterium]
MQVEHEAPRVVAIVGPTAVGKTEISLQLAEALNGEIVSTDSRQFYRGMDIGTAKATPEEQARVPHHLIDVADPDEIWSLAVFQKEAQRAIGDISGRGRLPFLVGGTGQYVRAVLEGWDIPAQPPVPQLRDALEAWGEEIGAAALYEKLKRIDPEAAEKIDANNLRRTVRALEVIFQTGRKFSSLRRRKASPYILKFVGLQRSRTDLYARIDTRIEAMIASGFLDEVQTLLDKGYRADLPNMSAIGYREMVGVLQGEMSLEEAVRRMKRLTRIFVRRQANWFKADDPNIRWFDADEDAVEQMIAYVRNEAGWIYPTQFETD